MSYKQNLKGKVFGTIKVLSESHIQNTHAYWHTLCLECGKEKTVAGSALSGGYANCLVCHYNKKAGLTQQQINEIGVLYFSGVKGRDIADEYGMELKKYYQLVSRMKWASSKKKKMKV